jgi:uncharacterized protein YkwD
MTCITLARTAGSFLQPAARLVCVLLAIGCALPARSNDSGSCFSAADVPELIAQLDALRAAGAVCGGVTMPPARALHWSATLAATARVHALDMAAHDRVSHEASDGHALAQRLRDGGYRFSVAGENVAGGQKTVAATLAAWLASPPHCSALMKAEFRDAGMACVRRDQGVFRTHWVLHLAAPLAGATP